jgi:glycosyltransferase involved in cell wall biosynthesis
MSGANGGPAGATPRLSIGLPVYNGEQYLPEALDALLGQTFTDFELIISDNASTDRTEEICREYARRDPRIRYIRQRTNIGIDPNHWFLTQQARGELFKWASHDDLYAPDLLRVCVEALDRHPEAVLAHAGDALVDEAGEIIEPMPYDLDSADPRPEVRLRSLLHVSGGNDDYGVIRSDVLRKVTPYGMGAYGSDRVFVAGLVLHGPFHHAPDILYFRRERPDRVSRFGKRDRALMLDPRRAERRWNPTVRLHLEYLLGFVTAIRRAPLSPGERARCLAEVARWLLSRTRPGRPVEARLGVVS